MIKADEKPFLFSEYYRRKSALRGNKNLNGKSKRKPFYRKFAKTIRRCATTTHGAMKKILEKSSARQEKLEWLKQTKNLFFLFENYRKKSALRGDKKWNGKSDRKPFYRKFAKKNRPCAATKNGMPKANAKPFLSKNSRKAFGAARQS